MDKVKSFVNNQGDLKNKLEGIQFPASKDEVLKQLQQRGVPSPIIDKLKNVDTSRFDSVNDVMAKL